MFPLFLILALLLNMSPAFAIDASDWQSNISSTCKATMSGRAKGVFSKYGFWFDTGVSMELWANEVRVEEPHSHCATDFARHKDKNVYMQCMAYYREKWDWFNRCKPIVDQLSREEGRK